MVVVLNGQKIKSSLETQGGQVIGNTPSEFASVIRSEAACWKKVVDQSGATID